MSNVAQEKSFVKLSRLRRINFSLTRCVGENVPSGQGPEQDKIPSPNPFTGLDEGTAHSEQDRRDQPTDAVTNQVQVQGTGPLTGGSFGNDHGSIPNRQGHQIGQTRRNGIVDANLHSQETQWEIETNLQRQTVEQIREGGLLQLGNDSSFQRTDLSQLSVDRSRPQEGVLPNRDSPRFTVDDGFHTQDQEVRVSGIAHGANMLSLHLPNNSQIGYSPSQGARNALRELSRRLSGSRYSRTSQIDQGSSTKPRNGFFGGKRNSNQTQNQNSGVHSRLTENDSRTSTGEDTRHSVYNQCVKETPTNSSLLAKSPWETYPSDTNITNLIQDHTRHGQHDRMDEERRQSDFTNDLEYNGQTTPRSEASTSTLGRQPRRMDTGSYPINTHEGNLHRREYARSRCNNFQGKILPKENLNFGTEHRNPYFGNQSNMGSLRGIRNRTEESDNSHLDRFNHSSMGPQKRPFLLQRHGEGYPSSSTMCSQTQLPFHSETNYVQGQQDSRLSFKGDSVGTPLLQNTRRNRVWSQGPSGMEEISTRGNDSNSSQNDETGLSTPGNVHSKIHPQVLVAIGSERIGIYRPDDAEVLAVEKASDASVSWRQFLHGILQSRGITFPSMYRELMEHNEYTKSEIDTMWLEANLYSGEESTVESYTKDLRRMIIAVDKRNQDHNKPKRLVLTDSQESWDSTVFWYLTQKLRDPEQGQRSPDICQLLAKLDAIRRRLQLPSSSNDLKAQVKGLLLNRRRREGEPLANSKTAIEQADVVELLLMEDSLKEYKGVLLKDCKWTQKFFTGGLQVWQYFLLLIVLQLMFMSRAQGLCLAKRKNITSYLNRKGKMLTKAKIVQRKGLTAATQNVVNTDVIPMQTWLETYVSAWDSLPKSEKFGDYLFFARAKTLRGLKSSDITEIVRWSMSHLGYKDVEQFSSHSLRSGGITTALTNNIPEPVIKKISGHVANSTAFQLYVRQTETTNMFTEMKFGKEIVPETEHNIMEWVDISESSEDDE